MEQDERLLHSSSFGAAVTPSNRRRLPAGIGLPAKIVSRVPEMFDVVGEAIEQAFVLAPARMERRGVVAEQVRSGEACDRILAGLRQPLSQMRS